MTQVWAFVSAHGPWFLLIGYIIFNAFVSSLRAPTATSSQFYVSLFAVLNALAVNFGRMFPKVESSPNFEPAVNLQRSLMDQSQHPVIVPPTVEPKP